MYKLIFCSDWLIFSFSLQNKGPLIYVINNIHKILLISKYAL